MVEAGFSFEGADPNRLLGVGCKTRIFMRVLGAVTGLLCGYWKQTQNFHRVLEADPGPMGRPPPKACAWVRPWV